MSNKPTKLVFIAAALPLALVACTAEPNTEYTSGVRTKVIYDETTAVTAPATSYYDSATHSTVYVSPTKTTTTVEGPAKITYQDSEGNWHNTYDPNQD